MAVKPSGEIYSVMTVRGVAPKREHFINIRRIEGHYRG